MTASTAVASPAPPLSERTALLVLGTMLLLIVALTIVLAQSTWADGRVATRVVHVAPSGGIARR